MDKRLIALLNRHEQEDSDELAGNLYHAIEDQFENADEIRRKMAEYGFNSINVSIDNFFHLDQEFIRKTERFEMRKHTASVVPYFHSHSYYELIYVYSGSLTQYLNKNLDKRVLKLRELCLVTPGSVHALERPCAKDIAIKISLPVKLYNRIKEKVADLTGIKDGSISYFKNDSLRFENYISYLLEELIYKKENMETAIECYLVLIFIELFRIDGLISDYQLFDSVKNYIKSNFMLPTLSGLAANMGYSSGHTGRLIRENLGLSFKELLRKIRMETAAVFLTETDRSVEDIAAELGYISTSGFYKQFNGTYGISPAKYRKK